MSEIAVNNQEQAVTQPKRSMVDVMPAHIVTAMHLAKTLAQSSLIPKALQGKPADTLIVLLKGEELGLQPVQSLGSIHVIEGKACCSAELTVALVMRSGKAEYFDLIESTAKVATYVTKRKGSERETKMSFTIEEATLAGLAGKNNWKTYPAAMLRARASQHLARAVYQEVTLGLVDEDEADELRRIAIQTVESAPRRARTLDEVVEQLQSGAVDVASTPVDEAAEPEQPANDSPEPEVASTSGQHPPAEHVSAPAQTSKPAPAVVTPITGNKARRF